MGVAGATVAVIGFDCGRIFLQATRKPWAPRSEPTGTSYRHWGRAAGFRLSGQDRFEAGAFSNGNNGWETIARLKPGITWTQARAAFAIEAERLWPNRSPLQRIKFPSAISELRDELAGPARKGSLVLMACVVLILLIACTNVANLLMARTADRATELSIRLRWEQAGTDRNSC
jgi:hypothetical protein